VPNFVAIGQAVAEICGNFSRWRPPPFEFSKFGFFYGQKGQRALRCQIMWRSVKSLVRSGNIMIFQNGGRRHL